MQFGKILKDLRKKYQYTQEQLADRLGVANSTVSMYERGERFPDYDMMKSIADIFNVDMNFLYNRTEYSDFDISKFHNIAPITRKRFPLLGEIACGEPIFAAEDHETYVEASADIKADFCLTAKGDSMIGARIQDGDIVFIREMPMVNNGEIAAVIIDNEATLKRVYYYPDKAKLILNPENPAYEPLVYIGEELNQIRILGRAVCFMSNL